MTAEQGAATERRYAPPLYVPPLSSDMCLEDVVKCYCDEERARKQGLGERDSDRRHIRSAVNELSSSIKVLAPQLSRHLRMSVSQSVLTKCMARHALCWYGEILGLGVLAEAYARVFAEAKRGHTVIRKQMEQVNFEAQMVPETVDVHWEVPNFVMLTLDGWKEPMSVETYTLLVYGMAWSLTTLQHREWDECNIETYFLPEIRHLEKMLVFRRIDLEAFRSKLEADATFVPKS